MVDVKMVKKTTVSRKRKVVTQRTPKERALRVVVFLVAIGFIGFLGKVILEQTLWYNPILGTWRTQTIMGVREVIFEKESMTSFGTKSPVKYDINGKAIVVMDTSLQLGSTYTMVDDDTMTLDMGKAKTKYKRVK